MQRADMREERGLTRAKAEELAAETIRGGTMRWPMIDATKGTAEKAKDTVIAEANENVMDTTEYGSIEDIGNDQNISF
ncbi:unnamed protein product [Citrullus colocynthis]|uniref:Uncharacterized protein n=1 Tax=Citrullus colocynthis TaxID=252529 RepID=A0ABP0Z0I8_9ROSI